MPLTSDAIIQIMKDRLQGKEPSIKGAEADKFREDLEKDIELAKKNNWIISIPNELGI